MSGRARPVSGWFFVLAVCVLLSGAVLVVYLFAYARRPLDARQLRQQAAAALKIEHYDVAAAALQKLPSKRPLDWVLQSKVNLAQHRPEEALADLSRIPDSDRLGALARYTEGVILLNDLHRALAAESSLRRAVALDPAAVPARQTLLFLYYTLSMKPEFGAQFAALEAMGQVIFDDVYHACVVNRGGTETEQIVERLSKFVKADPGDRRSRLALAEELRALNRPAEVEPVLAVLPDSDVGAQTIRARVALDRSDLQTASAILEAGPTDDPELAALRGRLALARRDAPSAVRAFRIAVTALPDRRDVLLGLGRALRLVGDDRSAAPYLKAAADHDRLALLLQKLVTPGATSDARLLHELGAACEALNRGPEARAWHRLALNAGSGAVPKSPEQSIRQRKIDLLRSGLDRGLQIRGLRPRVLDRYQALGVLDHRTEFIAALMDDGLGFFGDRCDVDVA
jgi:predicted Zn-dependent protease